MSPPTLTYARPLAQSAVRVVRDDDKKTIFIPQRRPIAAVLLAVMAIGLFVAAVVTAFVSPYPGLKQFTVPLQNLAFAGLFVWWAIHLLRPYRIEIDNDTVQINAIESIDGRKTWIRRPRASIYRVYAAEHAGAVFIRAHDREIIELPVTFRHASLHELAELIAGELGVLPDPRAETHPSPSI
ncbi:MAG TPA: hypothetical protein PKB10_05505 [Tepidisphaeraceae bacterium]|nr:hypothetical protein [Tepidisphaeraceae bacterium]